MKEVRILGLSMDPGSGRLAFSEFDLHASNPDLFPLDMINLLYRAVSYDRWPYVKEFGVDVFPTNSIIFCDALDKASEYGGWPKVILGYDRKGLCETYREVDATIDRKELDELKNKFPNVDVSEDGTKIWLSKMPRDDIRRGTYNEAQYAKWIPENPWESLKLIILADLAEKEGHL